jgi:NDP-sugar pyrophosphorylase family protein
MPNSISSRRRRRAKAAPLNEVSVRAVVLAGGRGTRLAPYTTVFPKPMMPLGERPILELLLRRLASFGVRHVTLSTGHLAYLIEGYFGDGRTLGTHIDYVSEPKPLGTAGPLSLVAGLDSTFLVVNGDLLTDVDLGEMFAEHRRRRAAATVGVYEREVQIDFGVIETDRSERVTGYLEKPTFRYRVSMGVYFFEPRVLRYVAPASHLDLPDLVLALVGGGEKVVSYLHRGYWLDIGRPEDYQRAQNDLERIGPALGMG